MSIIRKILLALTIALWASLLSAGPLDGTWISYSENQLHTTGADITGITSDPEGTLYFLTADTTITYDARYSERFRRASMPRIIFFSTVARIIGRHSYSPMSI